MILKSKMIASSYLFFGTAFAIANIFCEFGKKAFINRFFSYFGIQLKWV